MKAAASPQVRVLREVDLTPTSAPISDRGEREPESSVSLGISRDSQRELHATLAALVARTSLTTVVEGLANVALERSASQTDPATGHAWRRAAHQLRDVASRAGAMPDSL